MIYFRVQGRKAAVWQTMLLAVWVLVFGAPAESWAADVIQLKNGDRVSGKILTMEETVLSVDTDYADVIKIDWEDVKGLTSEKPLWVSFHDGAVIPEGVGIRDKDRLIVFRLEPDGPVQLHKIKTINLFELSYNGKFSLGGSLTSGNTDTESGNASGTLIINKGWHRIILDGLATRGKADGQLTAKNASVNTRWDYFFTKRGYSLVNNLSEYDKFQKLSYRNTLILGGGYDILNRKANFLTVAAGPTAIYQNFSTEPTTVIAGFSWLARWSLEFLKGDLKLWHHHIGTRDIGGDDAVRINAVQGISFKIYKDLSISLEYNIRHNSQPADGRKTTDTTIVFGLTLDLLG